MDAQQFLAEFGRIANAPGGVGKLRELVLAFAVQGTLVQQDATDESAAEWLSHLAVTKSELLKQKKIAKQTAFVDIPEHEHPYSLPRGWAFARLGAITNKIGSGSTPRGGREVYVRAGVPFLRSQNIWNDGIRLDDVAFITPTVHENMEGSAVKGDDILLNITGASLGRCALVPTDFGDANVSQHVTIIRPTDSAIRAYLHLCMLSPYTQAMIWERQVGMAREGLSKKVLEQFEIPLPPVTEQSRIVAKVDELMALCDQLEAQQQQRRRLQNNLRQSTLQAVAAATSPHELQTTWVRLADNFGQLFDAPEDVAELRGLILELASVGLLGSAKDEDSNPADLLSQVGQIQISEFSSRELREIQSLSAPTLLDGKRVRLQLGHICKVVSGQHLGPEEYNTREDGIPYITGPAEFLGRIPNPSKWTPERRAIAQLSDILITVKGSGVGKTAVCNIAELAISRQLMAIRPLHTMNKDFVEVCVQAAEKRFQQQKFGIAIPGIGRDEVLALEIVVPSVEEQARVVAVVRHLLTQCYELERTLANAASIVSKYVTSAVSAITGINAALEEDAPLKAPQTELIAPLRLGQTPDIKAQAPLATILARHSGELAAKDLWQRFGGEIDAFYAQLKQEVAHGWIQQPGVAEMREKAVA